MINVYYYCPFPEDATSFYRMNGVLPYIKDKELSFKDISHHRHIEWCILSGADVLIVQRPFSQQHASIISLAKEMNIKVIIDYDDDLLNIPQSNPMHELYKLAKDSVISCISNADCVWVSTSEIGKSFNQWAKNVLILNNSLNDYIFNKKTKNLGSEKIAAYRGGQSHEMDVYSKIDEIASVINSTPDWGFYFLGSRFPYLESKCGDNYYMTEPMNLIQYFTYLNNLNPSLFFYPLETNKFNSSKSNISFIEATYAGAAFIGNKELPEFQHLPIANINDVSDFNQILSDEKLRSRLHGLSWEYMMDNMTLSETNKLRVKSIKSMV